MVVTGEEEKRTRSLTEVGEKQTDKWATRRSFQDGRTILGKLPLLCFVCHLFVGCRDVGARPGG